MYNQLNSKLVNAYKLFNNKLQEYDIKNFFFNPNRNMNEYILIILSINYSTN